MRGICKHGNPLSNSCSFCKVEGKGDPPGPGRTIPRANQGAPLPTLRCSKCGYTTAYGDVLRRHACDATARLTTEETARELIDSLSWERPKPGSRAIKGITGWLAGLRQQPKTETLRTKTPQTETPPKTATEEKRLEMAGTTSCCCAVN